MRSSNRTHDRQSFFKYMSVATANVVLAQRTLRWSSPILFNDPFDVPREIAFGLAPEDIVQALSRRMEGLIENPPEDTSKLESRLRLIIDTVKMGIPDQLKAELLEGVKAQRLHFAPLARVWTRCVPCGEACCLTFESFA